LRAENSPKILVLRWTAIAPFGGQWHGRAHGWWSGARSATLAAFANTAKLGFYARALRAPEE